MRDFLNGFWGGFTAGLILGSAFVTGLWVRYLTLKHTGRWKP